MELKRGLWLILLDEAGEATPVACDVEERDPALWVLDALVPPQVYPVTFVAAKLRLDGYHLGLLKLQKPITTRTHEPFDVQLEFPIIREQYDAAMQSHRKTPVPAR